MYKKVCKVCGKEFEAKCKQQKLCSDDCVKENKKQYNKIYKKNNRQIIKEQNKKYRENHKEEILEYKKKNKKQIKEYDRQYSRQYRIEHPEADLNNKIKRRSKIEQQENIITSEQWVDMMKYFNWECAYSGEYIGGKINNTTRSADHIIPLNKCGLNVIWNLVPMHRRYNSSKQDKDMIEWYKQQDFYSEERLQKIYEWISYAKSKYDLIDKII